MGKLFMSCKHKDRDWHQNTLLANPEPWQGIQGEGFSLTASHSSLLTGFAVYATRGTSAVPKNYQKDGAVLEHACSMLQGPIQVR